MANIKITELNETLTKTNNDVLPIVDITANETKKIKIENLLDKNIELLAVSDTAPSECMTGDKYYNTSTKLIYTATAQDTWGTTGETPVSGILYIVYTDYASYSWNGTDLINIGGGSAITVHDNYSQSTTEPYSSNYVNSIISNVYGTSQSNGYSQEYINGLNTYCANNNIFTTTGATSGKYLDENGAEQSSGNWSYSDYIEVLSSRTYKLNNLLGNSPSYCFYDENKTFISGAKYNGSSSLSVTTPNNAKYIRLSYSTNGDTLSVALFGGIRIGTWYDGKPLYRAIVLDKLPNTATSGTEAQKTVKVDDNCGFMAIEWGGFFVNEGLYYGRMRQCPFTTAENYKVRLTAGTTSSGSGTSYGDYILIQNGYAGYNDRNFMASVIYTKTTD